MSASTARRIAYGVASLGLLTLAVWEVVRGRSGTWHVVIFAVAPDIPLVVGGTRQKGRINPRAVRFYNATHRLAGPALFAIPALGLGPGWLAGASAWAAHIALDRSLGFELRKPDGFPRKERPRGRTALRIAAGLAVLALAAGAIYEGLSARGDPERFPPPGDLVLVGDRTMHLWCVGSGSPTVVLETGLGESSLIWSLVQPDVGTARVCGYDRAGYGWSEPGPQPRTAGREASELRALLAAGGEPGPYVLVAHSIGANVTRLFVDRYPDEVAGVVLVDPTDVDAAIRAGRPVLPIAQYRFFSLLARAGLVRLFGDVLIPALGGTDPPDAVMEAVPVLYGPQALATAVAELEASIQAAHAVARATAPGAWGDLPLVVITAGMDGDPMHGQELATLSSTGVHRVAEGSGHYVQYDRPEVVIEAIRAVVTEARARS